MQAGGMKRERRGIRARLRPAGYWAGIGREPACIFFALCERAFQFVQVGEAHPVKLKHFPLAFGGFASGPKHRQDRGDERALEHFK